MTVGPDLIPVEVWKCFGEEALDWLTRLFNVIFRHQKCLRSGGLVYLFLLLHLSLYIRIRVAYNFISTIEVSSYLVML